MAPRSEAHIVPTSALILWIQGIIILCALTVIGLTSYAVNYQSKLSTYTDSGNSFGDIVAVVTILVLTYFFIAGIIRGPASFLYSRVAFLILLIIGVLAWLAVFVDMTEHLAGAYACTYSNVDSMTGRTISCGSGRNLNGMPYKNTTIAADALAGFIALLFGLNLALFSKAMHDHRIAGAPATFRQAQRVQQLQYVQDAEIQMQDRKSRPISTQSNPV